MVIGTQTGDAVMNINRDLHHLLEDLMDALVESGTLTEEDAHRIAGKGSKKEPSRVFSPAFEALWAQWPSRLTDGGNTVKVGKKDAWVVFSKYAFDEEKLALLERLIQAYRKAQPDRRYVKDFSRWLRSEPWMDGESPACEPVKKTWPEVWVSQDWGDAPDGYGKA
jgi:hypothetical protein